jgi:hypothetical protein
MIIEQNENSLIENAFKNKSKVLFFDLNVSHQ